jgi:GTPase SAR1 family protein
MIPVLIGLGIAALVGGITAAVFWDDIFDSEENKEKWDGKRIAVLGARSVGKTTLFSFLKNGEIEKNKAYQQTTMKERFEQTEVKIDDASLKISTSFDVGGGKYSYSTWSEEIKESDYILYLLDSSKVLEKDKEHISVIKSDMTAIQKDISKYKSQEKTIFLIATKSDCHSRYKSNNFEDELMNSPIILETILRLGGTKNCKFIVGSLCSTEEAKSLVKKMLNT